MNFKNISVKTTHHYWQYGKNNPFYLPPAFETFKRDLPKAEVHFCDTGHFALETHAQEIRQTIHRFLDETSFVNMV